MNGKEFGAYIPLTDDEKEALWKGATFVFDTNVLLSLYKLGHGTRQQVLALLQQTLAGRVWIPYHVAVEFYRNREEQLTAERRRIESASETLRGAESKLLEAARQVNLPEIGIAEEDAKLTQVTDAVRTLTDRLDAALASAPDLSQSDLVLDFLREFIGANVGPAPASQTDLDSLVSDGEDRYRRQVPPGYRDAKAKGEDTFVHDGLQYERRFGDLIVWKQLLEHVAREDGPKSVILVTAERKDDWWQKSRGEIAGPRVELRQEVARAGAERFHMYHLSSLLDRLRQVSGTEAQLPQEVIEEVQRQEVATSQATAFEDALADDIASGAGSSPALQQNALAGFLGFSSQVAVERWLADLYPGSRVVENKGFPDLLVEQVTPGALSVMSDIGVEVVTPKNPDHLLRLVERHLSFAHRWLEEPQLLNETWRHRRFLFVVTINRFAAKLHGFDEWKLAVDACQRSILGPRLRMRVGVLVGDSFTELPQLIGAEPTSSD